ncbi:MAG: energy-coupled thiamine transporter ThiT [Clostridia bacterium]|nr:energy-coupled thiamine transporter ThiT [Clostridia bacterium]
MLVEGAIMVAAAQVLSYIKLWRMPWGGSITLAMLPIVLFAVRWGLKPGLLAGFILGILQFSLDGGFAIGWQSIIGDYVLAYTALGLAGLAFGKRGNVFWGSLIGGLGRFLVLFVTGATLWAEYMPETFFNMTMSSPWFYSCLYNLAYMLPNIIICMIVFAVLYKPLHKYIVGEDIR